MSGALAAPLPAGAAAPSSSSRGGSRKVLPGFRLTLGFTLFYLCLIVLIPLAALVLKKYGNVFKPLKLFTVDEYFGGLGQAQKVHFNDGGQFDKLYTAPK